MNVGLTREQILAKYPNASLSFIRRNIAVPVDGDVRANSAGDSPLRPHDKKPTQRDALVSPAPRKGKSRKGAVLGVARRHIVFRVFAQRPADYDGYSVKELQDCLVRSGILDGDDWNLLYGTVISEKVHSKEEERTVIELT